MCEQPERIFSGDSSRDMWEAINGAKTRADLREALYFVCCRIQGLEARVEKRWAGRDCREEHPIQPFSVHLCGGNPDLFTVILCNDESLWVLSSTESRSKADVACRRLNKLLAGRISGLTVPGETDAARACDAEAHVGIPPRFPKVWAREGPFEVWNWNNEDGNIVLFDPDARQVLKNMSCVDAVQLCERLNECWAFSEVCIREPSRQRSSGVWVGPEPFHLWNCGTVSDVVFSPSAKWVMCSMSHAAAVRLCHLLNECWAFSKERD